MASFLRQLVALFIKHAKLKRAGWVSIVFELLIPVGFMR